MAHRGRRAGSLRLKKPPDMWEISAEGAPHPVTGKRQRKWRVVHGGRRDAERALALLITELADGRTVAGADTFADLLERWWGSMASVVWEDATSLRHRQDIDVHLARNLGRRKLDDLKPADFTAMYQTMTARGLAPRTIQHVNNTARAALAWGVKQGLASRNPAAAAVVPKRKRVPRRLPTAEQLDRVLDLAAEDSPMWHAFLAVDFATGARPAEVCALRWGDFDAARAELRIDEAIGRRMLDGVPGGWQVKTPKTATDESTGIRTVALDLATSTVLRRWRTSQQQLLLEVGELLADDLFMFPADRFGWRHLTPATPSRRWRRYAGPAGIPPEVRLYDAARHRHISWLLEQGFSVAEVAARAGNSPQTIWSRYSHILQSDQTRIAAAMDAANAARRAGS